MGTAVQQQQFKATDCEARRRGEEKEEEEGE